MVDGTLLIGVWVPGGPPDQRARVMESSACLVDVDASSNSRVDTSRVQSVNQLKTHACYGPRKCAHACYGPRKCAR